VKDNTLMKSISGSRLIRWPAAVCAAAVAIAGSALAAGPARAAEPAAETQHCVIVLPDPDGMTCFTSAAEAFKYATGGQEPGASKDPQATLRVDGFATNGGTPVGNPALTYTTLSWEFDQIGWTGNSVLFVGLNGGCTTSILDIDYATPTMPAYMNNRIWSFRTYNNCWTRHYDLVNWGLPYVGYSGTQALITAPLGADTSAERWS